MKFHTYYIIAIICFIFAFVFLRQGINIINDSLHAKDYLEQVGIYGEDNMIIQTNAIENMHKKGELYIMASVILFLVSAFFIGYSFTLIWKRRYLSFKQNNILPIDTWYPNRHETEKINKEIGYAQKTKPENLMSEAEKTVLKQLKNRVIEYTEYKVNKSWTSFYANMGDEYPREALIPLRKNLKEKGVYENGDYHFCQLLFAEKYPSNDLNAYFSRNFNHSCSIAFKRLLTNGIDKIKQEILLLSDYYLQELHVRVSKDYIVLKLQEAELLYNIEKQRANDKEEAKVQREFEHALKKAKKDEQKAREKLEEERKALALAESEKERARLEARIAKLEETMVQAQETQKRALSMAQQTRSGYVYVISNKGSFGEGVFKIGMTRRLDPMERVIELGDASVPFPFDVHTFIFSDDAPELETKLHQRFTDQRVNMFNNRKEFFRVNLDDVKKALEEFGVDTVWMNDDIP